MKRGKQRWVLRSRDDKMRRGEMGFVIKRWWDEKRTLKTVLSDPENGFK